MNGRNSYVVSYDIMDQKLLHKVHSTMKGFGQPIHYSVFLCDLTPKGRVELLAALTDLINHEQDRIMIVNIGPSDGRSNKRIEFMGTHSQDRNPTRKPVIV